MRVLVVGHPPVPAAESLAADEVGERLVSHEIPVVSRTAVKQVSSEKGQEAKNDRHHNVLPVIWCCCGLDPMDPITDTAWCAASRQPVRAQSGTAAIGRQVEVELIVGRVVRNGRLELRL